MITVLTPTGTLGYGFDLDALLRGMQLEPHVIAVDAGSTDLGPAYFGSAEPRYRNRRRRCQSRALDVGFRPAGPRDPDRR